MHFRGIIAPASLKPIREEHIAKSIHSFPGHHRPGLIEAVADPVRSTGLADISGASSPRPH